MPDRPVSIHDLSPKEHEKLARLIMRRQAALSLRVAAIFAVLILGLPLVNNYWPEAANQMVAGFPATWLFLGVLFFPITWLLAAHYVRASDHIEASCADWRHELGLEAAGMDEIRPAFVESGTEAEI